MENHDRRRQGGKSWRSPGVGGGQHGRMNKTIPCGCGFPYGGIFYVGSLFSPRRGHFFRMLWGVFFSLPPPWIFLLEPLYNCYHIFFTSHIFIFLPDRGGLNFWGNLFFFFSRGGGGLRDGGRLFSPFRLFFGEHAGPGGGGGGGGYRIMIVMWETEILTMGGGVRGYLFKLVLGRGGGGGKFLGGSNSSLTKKLDPPRSGKIFVTRGSRKNCYGGGKPNNAPPPHSRKRDPPTHGKNGMAPAYVGRKDCPHKNTPIGETPPPDGFFYSCFPHLASAYIPPLRAPIMIYDLHSLYSVCLRVRKKNQQKLNKHKNFLAISFNFLVGRCLDCIKYSEF